MSGTGELVLSEWSKAIVAEAYEEMALVRWEWTEMLRRTYAGRRRLVFRLRGWRVDEPESKLSIRRLPRRGPEVAR